MLTRPRAIAELLFAAHLWGFSFIGMRWSLDGVTPMWAVTFRFVAALLISAPWWVTKIDLLHGRLARYAGVALGLTLMLQVSGIQYTSVAKCGFITVLYVVWVPLAEGLALRAWPAWTHVFWVALALIGTALMSGGLSPSDWNRGDFLTLLCSIASAVHIIAVEKAQPKIRSAWRFNIYQSFWAGLTCAVAAMCFEPFPALPFSLKMLSGTLFNGGLTTLLAFWIQIRAQSVLSASAVSLLFLLESPLAALFGYLIFRETLAPAQLLGGALILVAAGGTIRAQLAPKVQ